MARQTFFSLIVHSCESCMGCYVMLSLFFLSFSPPVCSFFLPSSSFCFCLLSFSHPPFLFVFLFFLLPPILLVVGKQHQLHYHHLDWSVSGSIQTNAIRFDSVNMHVLNHVWNLSSYEKMRATVNSK